MQIQNISITTKVLWDSTIESSQVYSVGSTTYWLNDLKKTNLSKPQFLCLLKGILIVPTSQGD